MKLTESSQACCAACQSRPTAGSWSYSTFSLAYRRKASAHLDLLCLWTASARRCFYAGKLRKQADGQDLYRPCVQASRPDNLISLRDPRFTGSFCFSVFNLLGTKVKFSTTDHPETDGQTDPFTAFLATPSGATAPLIWATEARWFQWVSSR